MSRRARRIARPFVLLRFAAVAVVCAIAVAYVQPIGAYLDARDEVGKRRAETQALLRRQGALRHRLELAETDTFLEREARRLGLVRPGEQLFIVKGVERWKRAHVR
jgi:cell division protein FtsB